jgi:HAD superfamily hydrolase (TIGR01509 family)
VTRDAEPGRLAVTVDLDDTLFPQSSWLEGAWCAVAATAGRHGLPVDTMLAALTTVAAQGSDRGQIIDTALAEVGGDPQLVPELVAAFTGHAPATLPFYPGTADGLRRLRASGASVAVVTDGNPVIQAAKVRALGLADLVDAIVISDELGGRAMRKPHPAVFVEALRRLGAAAADAVHIGDRPGKDCAGAAAAGLRCIRVLTGEYAGVPAAPAVPAPWREVAAFSDAVDLLLAPVPSG